MVVVVLYRREYNQYIDMLDGRQRQMGIRESHRRLINVPFGPPEGINTSIKNIDQSNQVFKPAVATLTYTHPPIST